MARRHFPIGTTFKRGKELSIDRGRLVVLEAWSFIARHSEEGVLKYQIPNKHLTKVCAHLIDCRWNEAWNIFTSIENLREA